jgi:hypothetical protein
MSATRLLARGGLAVLVGLTALTVRAPGAEADLFYTGSVNAWGVRVSETIPGGPAGTDTLFDGGGPVAGASSGSSGTSSSFASYPYPGAVAVSLPSLLAGSGLAGLPAYPFYVDASYPTNPRPDPRTAPAGTLVASAGPAEAMGYAGAGFGDEATALGHFEATAAVSKNGESAIAAGTSVGRNVRFGPLEIGSLVSTAVATLDGEGRLARESTLSVTGMTVDGQGLVVSDGAIVLAGSEVPLAEAGGVTKALADAGVDVRYLAAQETTTGLTSAALAVSRKQEIPGGAPITVQFILGQVSASIDGGASDSGVQIGDVAPPATEQAAGTAPPTADVSSLPVVEPVAAPAFVVPVTQPRQERGFTFAPIVAAPPVVSAAPAPLPPTAAVAAPAPAAAPGPAPATLATVRRGTWAFNTESAYLLTAAALLAGVAVEILGRRKWRWNS